MPTAVLNRDRLLEVAGRPLTDSALDDLLFASKAEVEGHDGATITVSVTPDRLDLLSEGGLGLFLQGALEVGRGIPDYLDLHGGGGAVLEVDSSVEEARPAIAGAIVRAPGDRALDDGLLDEAVRLQEALHASVGRGRRVASLGIYPVDRFDFPVRYASEPLSRVRFVPLDATEEVEGPSFFEHHPMAHDYGRWAVRGDRCLTLRDASGVVLSLPPVLNSRTAGEARPGDRELLLESTGLYERSVREAVGLELVPFVARGWKVAPVEVRRAGVPPTDGRLTVDRRSVDLPSATVKALGGEGLASALVESRLSRSRLAVHPHSGGWRVDVPPWRPDLLTAVDVAEDVLLADGVRPSDGILPMSPTRGHLRAETQFRRAIATVLLGLGLAAPHTSVLVSDGAVARVGGEPPLRLQNPVSAEFAYLRNRLLLSHIEVLLRNTRHGYPQRFGEVGPVIVAAPSSETGADTRYHAGVVLAHDTASFADAAALVDYLLRGVDVVGSREPTEVPGTIPGRAARVRVAGEVVAELGELTPTVLDGLGVPVPVAWAEVDLTALWPLVARRDSH